MKKVLVTILLSVNCLLSFAQVKEEDQRKFDCFCYTSSNNIFLTGDKGFIMVYRDTVIKGEETWKIRQFDTDLKDAKTVSFKIERELGASIQYFNKEQNVYYKLAYIGAAKERLYKLFIFDANTSSLSVKEGVIPPKIIISGLKTLGHSLFITGSIKNEQMLLCINTETGKSNFINLPGVDLNMKVIEMETNEEAKLIFVTIAYSNKEETAVMQVCTYNESGEQFRQPIDIKSAKGKYPITSLVTWMGGDNFVVTGAYSNTYSANDLWTGGYFASWDGLYLASFSGISQDYIKYYSFSDVKNFNEYLSNKDKEKAENNPDKKKDKVEDITKYFVKTHKVIKFNNQYILIGEIYYTTFVKSSYRYANGNITTQNVFDGEQYTHAVVISVDKEGNKNWDNCVYLWPDNKPRTIVETVNAVATPDDLKLIFSSGAGIKAEKISKDGISDKAEVLTTDKEYESDKIKSANSVTSYWYDNYFLTYASNDVQYSYIAEKKRFVYFASKIEF